MSVAFVDLDNCERIVTSFRNTGHVVGSHHANVAVSIGWVTHAHKFHFPTTPASSQLLALYTAKLRRRNRSVPFDRQLATPLAKSVLDRASGVYSKIKSRRADVMSACT